MANKPAITITKPTTGAMGAATGTAKRAGRTTSDKVIRRGVGLRSSTMESIQQIADAHGLAENAVIKFIVEHGIAEYLANGPIKIAMAKRIKKQARIE